MSPNKKLTRALPDLPAVRVEEKTEKSTKHLTRCVVDMAAVDPRAGR